MRNQPVVACVADRAEAESCPNSDSFAGADAAPAVAIPSVSVRSYLQLFQCIALIITGDRVTVSRDPFTPMRRRFDAVYSAAAALQIKEACEAEEHADVVSVARGLRIALTSNADAITKAEAAIARMDVMVSEAQQRGLMKYLNHRYRQERIRARAEGRSFPSYGVIHRGSSKACCALPPARC